MYVIPPNESSKTPQIRIALGKDAYGEQFELNVSTADFIIPKAEDASCIDPDPVDIISSPHSNSFVDLNGDCMPDIFLQKQHKGKNVLKKDVYENYYEIYIQKIHKGRQMFCLQHTYKSLIMQTSESDPNSNIPLVDFVDIDSDGMIDLVFQFGKSIYVYYNMHEHLPFTGGYNEEPILCKKWDQTETGPIFMNFNEIPFDEIQEGGNQYVVIQKLDESFDKMKGIVDPLPSFPNQGRVRHSDINIDGFADLFLTLEFMDKTKQSVVLMSHPCSIETCPAAAVDRKIKRRYFKNSDDVVNTERITDLAGGSSVMLVPIDIDEDGRMDIIV